MKRDYAAIDKHLDAWASTDTAFGKPRHWWWNGDSAICLAIASACRHVRKDGCHIFDKAERSDLKKLEYYFYNASGYHNWGELNKAEMDWLSAEAFYLLERYLFRLWD